MKFVKTVLAVLFFLPFYGFGILVLSMGIDTVEKGWNARSWPVVAASLHDCVVTRTSGRKGPTFRADVKYTYVAGGKQYPGDLLRFDRVSSSDRERYLEECLHLRAMAPFMVRYDPEQPQVSVVFPPDRFELSSAFYFGSIWLLLVIILSIAALIASGYARAMLDLLRKLRRRLA